MSTRRGVAAAAVLALALVVVAGSGDSATTPTTTTTTSATPSIYTTARILDEVEAITDCTEVTALIEQALDDGRGYPPGDIRRQIAIRWVDLAQARLVELGCQ